MALVLDDRVKETSTTTGTGTLDLSGAVSGFQTFVAGVGDGNTTYYAIVNRDEAEWETGLGTITDASTDTLARTTVIASSNSDSAVSFSAGTKDVFATLPASKVSFLDASNDLIVGTGAAGIDYSLKFDGETSDGIITWMEDEDSFKVEDDLVMDSTKKLYFNDEGGEYISGDGTDLTIASGGDATIDAGDDIVLDADGADIFLKDGGSLFGTLTNSSGELVIKSSSSGTTAVTFSGANTTLAGTLGVGAITGTSTIQGTTITATTGFTIGSAAIVEAELETIDGVTAGTVAASKAVVVDSNKDIGTFRNVTIDGTFSDGNYTFDTSGNVSGLGTIGSGNITSTGTVQGTTITATTAFVPDASDGAALGTTALEFSDLFLADGAVINFGDDQDVTLTHVADTGLTLADAHANGTNLQINNTASDGDAAIQFALSGTVQYTMGVEDGDSDKFVINYGTGALGAQPALEISSAGAVTIPGDLTISGTISGAASAGFALAMAVAL